MSQLPHDVEEFVAKHGYQDGHDRFSCRCVSVEALHEWMSGHVRMPVETLDLMKETLEIIVAADWRKWEELSSPDEFVRWSKSRANHALSMLNASKEE